ncbi:hypothetical protein E1N66_19595 [Pantoea allii]|nr:hypothetical protein [Pantoea allii]THB82699.1 hypothetical protein E1N66_19595 [Pantoea allii]
MNQKKKEPKSMIEDFIYKNPNTADLGQAMIYLVDFEKKKGFEATVDKVRLGLPAIAEQLRNGNFNPSKCAAEHRTLAHQLSSELQKKSLLNKTVITTTTTAPTKKRL